MALVDQRDDCLNLDDKKSLDLEAVLERCRRRRAEISKERHERLTAEAIALGFSSSEERRQHDWNESVRREADFQRRLPEMAAAAGKTVVAYQRDLFAGNKEFIPPSPVPSFSQCDCEGKFRLSQIESVLTRSHLEHLTPWFCPGILLEYRSQDRADFWDYEELNRTRIETLSVELDDKSGRLDSKALERAWDMIGPVTLPLPIWARAKPEFLAMPRVDSTAPSSYLQQNTPSLVSASHGGDSSTTTPLSTPRCSSNDVTHNIKSKSLSHDRSIKRRAPLTAYEKCHIPKIIKRPQPPARRTRSHKTILFYELDRNGRLLPSRGF
ncbi:hypothetical protein MMC17_004322 [Xylographa soralifera]|nr:hypothetical protein [Xylographa soralifera]